MPKISFIYSTPKPWEWSVMCVLGVSTLSDERSLEICLGLYFLEIGIRIDWGG